jgi:phosphoribosyl 1,2-cyclic phosphodiesterase
VKLTIAPLFSGSKGNSTYISTDKTSLLVDAGMSGSAIEKALAQIEASPAELSGILVTHEHTDHIRGVGVLSRRYDIPIFANALTWEAMQSDIGRIKAKNECVIDRGEFYIGDICARPIPLMHDAADPTGYALCAGGKQVGILTDTGKVTRDMLDTLADSSIVLLESNHDETMLKNGPYPYSLKQRILSAHGHLSNIASCRAAKALAERGVRGVLLAHLSEHNNTEPLAYRTVCDGLAEEGVRVGVDIALALTQKLAVTGVFGV